MNHFLNLVQLDVSSKRVFLRVDYNVSIKDGVITNDDRIRLTIPTIEYLMKHDASKIIIASHLDDPYKELKAGRRWDDIKKEQTLRPVAQRLSKLLNMEVAFAEDYKGAAKANKKIVLLENLRFNKEEMSDDEGFAKSLASMADVYVNDAFGVAHRKHASVSAITKYLPSALGFLMQKELKYLTKALEVKEKPFIAILGGAKVSDKIKLIKSLLNNVDKLLIGGAMSFGFFKAMGKEVGLSLCEGVEHAKELIGNKKIILPVDIVIAKERNGKFSDIKTVQWDKIPKDFKGLDIGPKTIKLYEKIIREAKTVLWNGPLGLFEIEPFNNGTKAIAHQIAISDATTIVGGGDSAAALDELGLSPTMTHVSTGGGAALVFLEGTKLPALKALEDSYKRMKR